MTSACSSQQLHRWDIHFEAGCACMQDSNEHSIRPRNMLPNGRVQKYRWLWQCPFKGAVSRYSVIFCAFFARPKNGGCSRKCRGHHLKAWPSAWPGSRPPALAADMTVPWTNDKSSQSCTCFTCRRRLAALLFSGYEARARSYPLLQGSRLAATAISIDSLFGCLVLRAFRSLLRRSRRREHGWLGEGFGSVVVAPFPVTLTMCVTVKANALNEERVRGTDVDVRANTGFVVAFAQYVTKTWRLKKRTCGKLRGRPARRQRTFEGDAQGPCMSSINFFLPEGALLSTAHPAVHLEMRRW